MASTSEFVPAAVNSFTLALLNRLSDEDKKASIISSPLSISAALSMVMLGARGNTKEEMLEVLRLPNAGSQGLQGQQQQQQHQQQQQQQQQQQLQQPQQQQQRTCTPPVSGGDDVHAAFGELLNQIDVTQAVSIANGLFGEKSFRFVPKYIEDTKTYYSAELKNMNFKNNAEAARVEINTWVEEKTEDKIKDLLGEGTVNDQTKLVLVNAIYFKAKWEKQFNPDDSFDGNFRINKKDTKSVKMIRQTSWFPVKQIPEVGAKVLEMPYQGGAFSMLVLLPDDIEDDSTGLEKLEKELQGPGGQQKFEDWTSNMENVHTYVQLPKFTVEASYQLKDVLMNMGMKDVFTSNCNLLGISENKDLAVSEVIHKAFVAVDEEGTEAAAATAVVMLGASLVIPFLFTADHPFLFFIRHVPTKTVVFAGRFCGPE